MKYNTGNYDGLNGYGTYDNFLDATEAGSASVNVIVSRGDGVAFGGVFSQQPHEVLDYDVDFTPWLEDRPDQPLSAAVSCDAGLVISSSNLFGNIVRVVVGGGVTGTKYKVTVRLTTNGTPAIVKEVDFLIRVREL